MACQSQPRSTLNRPLEEGTMTESLTPARQELLAHACPFYPEIDDMPTSKFTLSAIIEPDDWRLVYLVRKLTPTDRSRVLEFAELPFNLAHARRRVEG
jgi:hypothetical protein